MNGIYIDSLNINLNLQIKISLPPSPVSPIDRRVKKEVKQSVKQTLKSLRDELMQTKDEGENLETSFIGVTPSKPNQANNTNKLF